MKPFDVLIIEDNEGDNLSTTESLKKGNIINFFSVVNDGWEAIDFLLKKGDYAIFPIPNLILLEIRADEPFRPPLPILSTSTSQQEINYGYKNYGNCFISKASNSEDLLGLVPSIQEFWTPTVQLTQNS